MTKHADTLAAILAAPTKDNLDWRDIESMLDYYGAQITEGRNSRLRVRLTGVRASFHRPDEDRPATRPVVRSVARLLRTAGIEI
jgi:hypothetical protein